MATIPPPLADARPLPVSWVLQEADSELELSVRRLYDKERVGSTSVRCDWGQRPVTTQAWWQLQPTSPDTAPGGAHEVSWPLSHVPTEWGCLYIPIAMSPSSGKDCSQMPMALCEVMLNKGDIPQRADHRRLPTNGLPGNQGNQCFLEGNSGHRIYTWPAKAMHLRDCIRYPNAFRDPGFKDFPLHPSCRRGLFAIRVEDPSPAVDCSRWVGERRCGVIGINQSQFKSWLSQTGSYVTWGGRLQILHEDHKSERLLSI